MAKNPTTRKAPEMATVLCPLCKSNPVPAPKWDFDDTSVTVDVCEDHGAAHSVTLKVAAVYDLYPREDKAYKPDRDKHYGYSPLAF